MSELKCVKCGKVVEKAWLEEHDMGVPVCPECYEKLRNRFEELTPSPAKFTQRCNLR